MAGIGCASVPQAGRNKKAHCFSAGRRYIRDLRRATSCARLVRNRGIRPSCKRWKREHGREKTEAETVSRHIGGESGGAPGNWDSSADAHRTRREEAEIQGRKAQTDAEQAAG